MKRIVVIAAVLSLAGAGAAWAQEAPATRSSISEGQARSLLTAYGCTNISQLGAGPGGTWHGTCTKGGQVQNVMVDAEGKAGPAKGVTHVTEGNARSALTAFGCSNISTLSRGPEGTWHGKCTKGGQVQDVMVDSQGKAMMGTGKHITEAHARSSLMQFGCSNISTLSQGADGSWSGMCSKGGRTVDVMVNPEGKAATK